MLSQAELLGVVYSTLVRLPLIPNCGLSALLPDSILVESPPGTKVGAEFIVSGNLGNWNATAQGKVLAIDPERGRMLFIGAAPPEGIPRATYYYGFPASIGAGSYDRGAFVLPPAVTLSANVAITSADIPQGAPDAPGVLELGDSSTFGPAAGQNGIQNTQVQGRNQQRPYLRLAADWTLDTTPNTSGVLTIEGLWVGVAGNFSLILSGRYKAVTIRHSTLDPGGSDAQGNRIERK